MSTETRDLTAEISQRPVWRRRPVRATVITVLVALVAVTARLFVWPAEGVPPHVSAIVMMAGPGDRLSVALELAREHRAPVLVVSQGWEGYGGPCPPKVSGVQLICFDPNPGTTRGEAEFAGQLAKRYHWSSIALVTLQAQDTRARLLLGRCFSGPIYVATAPLPWPEWPFQLVYQWGAMIKALVDHPSC